MRNVLSILVTLHRALGLREYRTMVQEINLNTKVSSKYFISGYSSVNINISSAQECREIREKSENRITLSFDSREVCLHQSYYFVFC